MKKWPKRGEHIPSAFAFRRSQSATHWKDVRRRSIPALSREYFLVK